MNNDTLKISDIIDTNKIQQGKINMIVAGCGTGKSYFAINTLSKKLNIRHEEILIVTSRSMTRDQQEKDKAYKGKIKRISTGNIKLVNKAINNSTSHRIGKGKLKIDDERKVHICTYNWFNDNYFDYNYLEGVKVIVFDEIHTLFTDIIYNKSLNNILLHIKEIMLNHIVIGMTATDIEIKRNTYINNDLNYLLDKPYYIYNVQKSFNVISKLRYVNVILNNIKGNSLYMSASSKRAIKLAKEYDGKVIISEQNENYNDSIKNTRNYVIDNKTLPINTNILFCTSCMREGMELKQESNIKNIFIESSDPNMIIQFIGRYRNNIDNVYIINNHYYELKEFQDSMTHNQKEYHNDMKRFINDKPSRWKHYFSNIINTDININIIKENDIEESFINYIEDNFINKIIYKKEDKQLIVNKSKELGFKKDKTHPHSFNSIIKYLEYKGYKIEKKTIRIKGKQYRTVKVLQNW